MGERKYEWSDFSVQEWTRLDGIARAHDRRLKVAFTKAVTVGVNVKGKEIRDALASTVAEVGVTTARIYGLAFNARSPRYSDLVEDLTSGYMATITDTSAREAVKRILPSGLSLTEVRRRLNTAGLDVRSALTLEKMRQEGASLTEIGAKRTDLLIQRGNLLALTEINRAINATLEELWLDNMRGIQKAVYGNDPDIVTEIKRLTGASRKTLVTRRDGRVCNYCLPLDGKTVTIGRQFNTRYGKFKYPPFHPRCRCYMLMEP